MDLISALVGFRHPAIDSVIDSVDEDKKQIIDSVIDSALAHARNEEVHAQQIIVSAGKYIYFFLTETMANFKVCYSPRNKI